MARRNKGRSVVFIISIGAHLALVAAIAAIPQQRLREVIAIAMAETPKHDDRPKPPATPPPARSPSRAHPAGPSQTVAAANANEMSGAKSLVPYLDIGLSLDSSSSDGLAIPISATIQPHTPIAAVAPIRPKVLSAKSNEIACTEDLEKPVARNLVEPKYTSEAENAGIEGRVRLTLQIAENGEVESAQVLRGLGYGLDEAAIEAAKHMKFRPASRCGRPVSATFTLAVRFKL